MEKFIMRFPIIKVKDKDDGHVHIVGTDVHDTLLIEEATGGLKYYNLQNCEGTDKNSCYEFVGDIDFDDNIAIEFVTIEELIQIYKKQIKVVAEQETAFVDTFIPYLERFEERVSRRITDSPLVYPFMSNIQAFCDFPNEEFEKFIVSCDYGTVNPTSFGLWAKGEETETWYRISEYYYDSKREGMQKTDEEHYKCLCELIAGRKIEGIVVEPSAASFIGFIKRRGFYNVFPAKNNVLNGIRRVSAALKNGEIKICITCSDSIKEFSLYRWDKNSSNALPLRENDHAMDDIRYFVTTILDTETDGRLINEL